MRRLLTVVLVVTPAIIWAQGQPTAINYTRPPFSGGVSLLAPAADNCTTPPFSFTGDATTGVCSSAAGTVNLRTAGANSFSLSATVATLTVPVLFPNGSAAAPGIAFATNPGSGFQYISSSAFNWGNNGTTSGALRTIGISLKSAGTLGWSQSSAPTGGDDLVIGRAAAATLQVGSTAAAATGQTIKGSDATGDAAAGGSLTLRGGSGTGTGNPAGGNLILGGGAPNGTGARGVVMFEDGGTKPTCAAGIRGAIWYDAGAAGVLDTLEVCRKDASNNYAWVTLF